MAKLTREDLIDFLNDCKMNEITQEHTEAYCLYFGRLDDDQRKKIRALKPNARFKIGKVIKTMRDEAIRRFEQTGESQLLPNGFWIKPMAIYNHELHEKWVNSVPIDCSIEHCRDVLQIVLGVPLEQLVENIRKREAERRGLATACGVPEELPF